LQCKIEPIDSIQDFLSVPRLVSV